MINFSNMTSICTKKISIFFSFIKSEIKPQDPRTIDYLKKLLEEEKSALECNLQQEKNKQKEINDKMTPPENPTFVHTEINEATKEPVANKSDIWSAGNLLGTLTKELNKTKQKYSKQVWDQDELQQDLQFLTNHQKEVLSVLATKPKSLTPGEIPNILQLFFFNFIDFLYPAKMKLSEQSIQADELKKFNKRLTRNISTLKQKYTENTSVVASRLMAEKDVIKNKLKSRTGIEEVQILFFIISQFS